MNGLVAVFLTCLGVWLGVLAAGEAATMDGRIMVFLAVLLGTLYLGSLVWEYLERTDGDG